jgi:perosamine synthetase
VYPSAQSLFDLVRIGPRERRYVDEVLAAEFRTSSGAVMTERLERAFADLVGASYAISFVNGTATMHACLAAAGIGPGDEVVVPPLTMASTTLAVLHAGAVPVFADVERDTFVIDPASVRGRMTARTRAIIPVALYGLAPNLDSLGRLAEKAGIFLLEDNAEAFLATADGRRLGTHGDAASFSFQSSKHLTSGEGGIVTTDDADLADSIRRFNSLGYAAVGARRGAISRDDIQDPTYSRHVALGFNYRMPELCAAVALGQVERAEELVCHRVEVAARFEAAVDGCSWLAPQRTPPDYTNSYWTFALRLTHPDVSWHEFRRVFLEEGGDPFYGAWQLTYLEPLFADGCPVRHPAYEGNYQAFERGLCPVAEEIQPQLIQLKTNYWSAREATAQADALSRTIARCDA